MSYIVNWSSTGSPGGKPAITVAERTFDAASTSLVLTGKGLNNYGLFQQENFLKLLENFAYFDSPPAPTTGQLWYSTADECLKIWDGTEWKNVCADAAFGLGDYSPTVGPIGFAARINRIIGTPDGPEPADEEAASVWGWGQTDWVPTYNASGALDSTSIAREADLPGGEVFPRTFNNNAWAIAISRLRKALRQTGLDESETSLVGFVNDGLPNSPGNSLANAYNNFVSGTGTIANIAAGYGGLSTTALTDAYLATEAALDALELHRFSLGAGQSEYSNEGGPVRDTSLGFDLNIPTAVDEYIHTVTVDFEDEAAAEAFFNAGGLIQFEPSFTPSEGSPSNVEQDWEIFLNAFSGFCFDYYGVKTTPAYRSPSFTPTYLPVVDGGTEYLGYYDLNSTYQTIFQRDVLDTPGNIFVYSTPTNGGMIIRARKAVSGLNYRVTFAIEYRLLNVTTGLPGQNDTTDTQLNGALASEIGVYYASAENCNSPGIAAPVVAHSGTFTESGA